MTRIPIPDYGDVFTLDEWWQIVASGAIIDSDGSGRWQLSATEMAKNFFNSVRDKPPIEAIGVVWFNK